MNSDYLEAMWATMVRYGGVLRLSDDYEYEKDVNFYGGCLHVSKADTQEAITHLRSGVNWQSTEDPASHSAPMFAGTFTSHDYSLNYLKGTITAFDGFASTWAIQLKDGGMGLQDVLKILAESCTFEESLDAAQERVDGDHFEFHCNL